MNMIHCQQVDDELELMIIIIILIIIIHCVDPLGICGTMEKGGRK